MGKRHREQRSHVLLTLGHGWLCRRSRLCLGMGRQMQGPKSLECHHNSPEYSIRQHSCLLDSAHPQHPSCYISVRSQGGAQQRLHWV